MKKLLIICIAVFLLADSIAFAVELYAPTWRGAEGSTYQEWGFSDSNTVPVPDVVDNPYGDPKLRVTAIGDWVPEPGAWPLSGEIDVYIPNWNKPNPEKQIWIQLVWKATDVDPFLPNEPMVGVAPFESMQMSRTDWVDFAGNGWNMTLFEISIWPNPIEEWITIKGDIMVDWVGIDTICIPEPATLILLGFGGAMMTLARKRRSV